MKIRILTAADVKAALPMRKAIEAVKSAFGQFSARQATVPLRTRFHTEKGVTLLMPAHLKQTGDFALKVVSVYGQNPEKGLPTVTATVLVLDPETGLPLAFMDGDSLTALRTGAAGGAGRGPAGPQRCPPGSAFWRGCPGTLPASGRDGNEKPGRGDHRRPDARGR